jgi:hypothetical protein
MFTRRYVGAALACVVGFLAGCGNGAAPDNGPSRGKPGVQEKTPVSDGSAVQAKTSSGDKAKDPKLAGPQTVTLHVKDMVERLKLV